MFFFSFFLNDRTEGLREVRTGEKRRIVSSCAVLPGVPDVSTERPSTVLAYYIRAIPFETIKGGVRARIFDGSRTENAASARQ